MFQIFNDFFYQPIFNVLVWIYNILPNHDLGLAIIILTLIIRLILFPLAQKQIRSQRSLTKLQPKIEELKLQYKDNKDAVKKINDAMLGKFDDLRPELLKHIQKFSSEIFQKNILELIKKN